MYIHAEFPAGIDSRELYEMVKRYDLDVTDIITKVYLYGEVPSRFMAQVVDICAKFGYKSITIKNPTN